MHSKARARINCPTCGRLHVQTRPGLRYFTCVSCGFVCGSADVGAIGAAPQVRRIADESRHREAAACEGFAASPKLTSLAQASSAWFAAEWRRVLWMAFDIIALEARLCRLSVSA